MDDSRIPALENSGKTRILYLITALVIAVFVAYGLVSWLTFRGSQNRLVEKSREKLIQTQVDNITSTTEYLSSLFIPMFNEKLGALKPQEIAGAFANKVISDAQRELNAELKRVSELRIQGQVALLVILMPTPLNPEPLVILSSDESLVYNWKVPDYLVRAIEDGEPYIWMEDGVPELSLQGQHVMVLNRYDDPEARSTTVSVSVKAMGEELADIEGFFDREQNHTNLVMGIVVVGSVVVVFIITFFVLSFLIRRRITKPIEELAAAAEKVMEGDLDVDIRVHEGSEFETLERAFKEMVESFRKYIARSVGED